MSEPYPDYVHDKVQGIDVVTLIHTVRWDEEQGWRTKRSLCDLVDGGVEHLILNCSNIPWSNLGFGNVDFDYELFTKMFVMTIFALRERMSRKESSRGLSPGRILRVCADRETALDVISRSATLRLVVCSLGPGLPKLFGVIGLCDGPGGTADRWARGMADRLRVDARVFGDECRGAVQRHHVQTHVGQYRRIRPASAPRSSSWTAPDIPGHWT